MPNRQSCFPARAMRSASLGWNDEARGQSEVRYSNRNMVKYANATFTDLTGSGLAT
jgi:hypothetical protein